MPESIFAAMLRTGSWASRAACRSTDEPNIFFPRTESVSAAQHAAETYCNACPVRPQCLDQALASGAEGIWAGTTASERRKLARTRNRERCPLCASEKRIFVKEPAGHTDHELCLACGVSWKVSEGPDREVPALVEDRNLRRDPDPGRTDPGRNAVMARQTQKVKAVQARKTARDESGEESDRAAAVRARKRAQRTSEDASRFLARTR
jgi:WhiB family transcriptional regulator, redox-sensing transcriptional regulator